MCKCRGYGQCTDAGGVVNAQKQWVWSMHRYSRHGEYTDAGEKTTLMVFSHRTSIAEVMDTSSPMLRSSGLSDKMRRPGFNLQLTQFLLVLLQC